MPIIGSIAGGSAGGFGQRKGGKPIRAFDVLFVAGGGAGCTACHSPGGGGGGVRTSFPGGTQLEIEGKTTYTVTVGAGAPPNPASGGGPPIHGTQVPGNPGGNSEIYLSAPEVLYYSSGGGGGPPPGADGKPGGAGSGTFYSDNLGAGNAGGFDPTTNVNGVEGYPGRRGQPFSPGNAGGGGGGAGAQAPSQNGGAGIANSITGSSVTYGGGGAGGWYADGSGFSGGPGGGGSNGGISGGPGTNGLGGGGSGGGPGPSANSGAGGHGRIVLRYPSEFSTTVAPGTNTITDHPGGDKLATFNVSGTLSVD
jgi:hypothetical protein